MLDEKDSAILDELMKDSRKTTKAIARALEIPRATVHDRIARMEARKVIRRYTEVPDYAQLAVDMGAVGFRVESYKDVAGAVSEAVECGKPVVTDAVIEGGEKVLAESFRRDALKPAYNELPKYKHLNVE